MIDVPQSERLFVDKGISTISNFPWPGAPVADSLEIAAISGEPLQLFVLTLEEALRR